MTKMFIQAIAIAAMLLSPSLASARIGGPSVSPKIGNVGTVRVTPPPPERTPPRVPSDVKPRIHSDVKLLNCHTYERRSPYHDTVVTRTVCR